MGRKLRIAIYMRLSKEDEGAKEESNSIRTQRLLLHDYVEGHFDEYQLFELQDDGYSGTNLRRPGMARLLEMVRASELDCIIVKDFSRFSRDYIELGTYMEQVFPFMGIRFISVNDHYDSESSQLGDMDISFRNLMYDLYSKDLSIKVKSSFAIKKERGQYISANCPFGYEKSPQDKHKLVIEEDEAEVVRRIFCMTLEGRTSVEVAKALNREGVRTPAEYKLAKGKKSCQPKGEGFSWNSSMVCQILRNRVYTGDMVYGKTYQDAVGGKTYLKPREEWKVFLNHHAPIISREMFEEVQERRGKRVTGTRPQASGTRHCLTGKLICACCGKSLRIRQGLNPYFCCPCVYVNAKEECVRRVNVMFLEQYVLYELYRYAVQHGDTEILYKEKKKELKQKVTELMAQKRTIQIGMNALNREKIEAYEQYAQEKGNGSDGTIEEAFRNRFQDIKERLAAAGSRLQETESLIEDAEKALKKKTGEEDIRFDIHELNREVVQRYIDKIVVKSEEQIEICWKVR